MSSFLKQSFDFKSEFEHETMFYQPPFKITIHQSNHGVKHLNYDADTEDGDIIIDEWFDYSDSYDDSKFFIFELDM